MNYDGKVRFGKTGHGKGICVLDLEAGGGRFISAASDGTLALWDYGGMDRQLLPYRLLDPLNNALPLRVAAHDPLTNTLILVASGGEGGGGNKMRLLKRSGSLQADCAQGDPYVMDQRVTRGHTQGITGGLWSRTEASKFYTCGLDGTVRIWNTEQCHLKNDNVLVVSKVVAHGAARSTHQGAVTCMALSPESDRLLLCGLREGNLKAYNPAQPIRPVFEINSPKGALSVSFNPFDENGFGVRTGNSVQIYDLRNPKTSISQVLNEEAADDVVAGNFEFTSPKNLLLGFSEKTAARKNDKLVVEHKGRAQLWDYSSNQVIQEWDFDNVGVTQVAYQPKLDQIILGHSDGSLSGIFQSDPPQSHGESVLRKGIRKALAKDPPKKDTVMDTSHLVATPEPAPYLTNLVGPDELDHLKTKGSNSEGSKAAGQVETPRRALEGRIAQSSITQRILIQHVPVIGRDEDPREALLRLAKEEEQEEEEQVETNSRKKIKK